MAQMRKHRKKHIVSPATVTEIRKSLKITKKEIREAEQIVSEVLLGPIFKKLNNLELRTLVNYLPKQVPLPKSVVRRLGKNLPKNRK